jgi:hypothetical protein
MERAGAADLIVVDGPASGHTTTLFTSAEGLLDSSRAGPIRAQAADVVELVSDPARCQVVLVNFAMRGAAAFRRRRDEMQAEQTTRLAEALSRRPRSRRGGDGGRSPHGRFRRGWR